MRNAGGGLLTIGKSKARVTGVNGGRPSVVFDDVAGVEEAKLELQEVVEFLKGKQTTTMGLMLASPAPSRIDTSTARVPLPSKGAGEQVPC